MQHKIESIISSMPKSKQREFLNKKTSSKGKRGDLFNFCSQDNWQDAAIIACNSFFVEIGEPCPKKAEEQIGYGLIVLGGQNPSFEEDRGAWGKNPPHIIKALKAAVLAAGHIALSIRNLPSDLRQLISNLPPDPCQLLTERLERLPTSKSIDTEVVQSHQHTVDLKFDLVRYSRELESQGYFDPKNEIDARKRILTSIVQRAGQAHFREQLLEAYDNRCAITECNITFALEAAHIFPYKGEHTNDVRNGLLLRADIHTLFDLGNISINPENYCIVVSDDIRKSPSYGHLYGKQIILPIDNSKQPDKEALSKHFKNAFPLK